MSTKERILQAAHQVAQRDGVIHLTLEAVAKEAGLSKGGLLYHFPTKDDLVAGLVAHVTDGFATALEEKQQKTPEGTGAFTRSYIRATFEDMSTAQHLHTGLLAAVLLNPELLQHIQDKFAAWHKQIQHDGLDPVLASLLRYAADGMWASMLLGLAPPDDAMQDALHEFMIDFTQEDGPID